MAVAEPDRARGPAPHRNIGDPFMTRVVLLVAALLGWATYQQLSRRPATGKLYGRQPDAFPFPTGAGVSGIDLEDEGSVRDWCASFGCSEEQLRAAIHHVGSAPAEVRRHLSRRR
jgi:hypothetical protein